MPEMEEHRPEDYCVGLARVNCGMATGWAHEGAVQEQIDATVQDAVNRAKEQLPHGPGALQCVECGEAIPEARRAALPGVQLCVICQEAAESRLDGSPAGR